MASVLFRLGRFAFRHKWSVIAGWVLGVVVVATLVSVLNPTFAKDFSLPGTDADKATSQVAEYFPAAEKAQKLATTSVLVAADDGLAAHNSDIDALVAGLRTLPGVDAAKLANPTATAAANPQAAAAVLGDGGKVGLIQITQSIEPTELKTADKTNLTDILSAHRTGGLQVEATGSLMQVRDAGMTAELLGFAVAFIVMIVAFGALIAAFIPLVTAIIGVVLSTMLVTLGASVFTLNETATAIVTMLGIAVSIDYALFIVSRYRDELRRGGSREDAVGRAVGTAGSAVVFAGLTVIIAVVALTVIGIPLIAQMGLGAAVAVVVAVASAITLIPALLGAFGRFAFTPRIPWLRHGDEPREKTATGERFGKAVVRRPWLYAGIGLIVLVICAIPTTKLQLGLSTTSDAEAPAMSLLQRGFGEGINGPLLVVVHADSGSVTAAADQTVAHIKGLKNVVNPQALTWTGNGTSPQQPNVDANTALITVTAETSPSSTQTHDLMEQIRDFTPTVEKSGAELHVGGQTAITSDLSAKLSSALIPYLIVVVALAFLLMIAVFRSLWVPLIATVGFLFSVLATFGATVALFQEGMFGLISNPQPILSFLPVFLIGVVFGLAMDYQVFLVTRMREEYVHGASPIDAIIAGYHHGARVVTSAAIIMISVFASFMLAPDTTSKMLGFGLAAAVFFDAFIIRMMVVPAVIALLKDKAWGLPAWLDRLVPNFDIEGTKIKDNGLTPTPELVDSSAR